MKRAFPAIAGMLLLAAAVPALSQDSRGALGRVVAGQWELSEPGSERDSVRMCIADPTMLAQVAHRGRQCTRVTISEGPGEALIHYTCTGAGFGRASMQVVTPRSLRIETQGILRSTPFHRVYHARRTGDCR
ncbi:hypothetical protein [Sphingomicrobium lutaoense]|uniref:DUF3617 family protein n=1 Tax=Sphingomicrobium lutaoense TaxID=515949 RepID=A0A839Z5M2_9SPHN|nr:hypothetical protein [Sphingomicrobium lutaoense]MBB3763984.1 hypothetical protein [Sphingomicrobium lutaoense]